MNTFYRIRRDFFLKLFRIVTHTLHIHHNISFLVFLTFWIYSYASTNFQVMDRYFPFNKKILCFFRSSPHLSGLSPIEKCLLKKGLEVLCRALVCYYEKSRTEIRSLSLKSDLWLLKEKKYCRAKVLNKST